MKLFWAAGACMLLAGCGGDSDRPSNTPTVTSTSTAIPTATPTATPTPQNVYELTEQSRFHLPDGSEEPATGSVAVIPCLSPNTFYAYRIKSLAIASESVVISSDVGGGELEAVTFPPSNQGVSFTAFVLINGASGLLTGFGPIDDPPTGETLTLELNAAPFALQLEAQRTGPPYRFPSTDDLCFGRR